MSLFLMKRAAAKRAPTVITSASFFTFSPVSSPLVRAHNLNFTNDEIADTTTSLNPGTQVNNMAFSPDGKFVALATNGNGSVQVWRRTSTGYERCVLGNVGDQNNVIGDAVSYNKGVSFSADGKILMVAGYNARKIFLLERSADGLTYNMRSSSGDTSMAYAQCGQMSPDGTLFAYGNNNFARLEIWGRSTPTSWNLTYLTPVPTHGSPFTPSCIAFSKDSKFMFVASYTTNYSLYVYERNPDNTFGIARWMHFGNGIKSLELSPDETHLAVTMYDSPYVAVFKWDKTTKLLTDLNLPAGLIPLRSEKLSYSSDSKYLLVGHQNTAGNPKTTMLKRVGDTYSKVPNLGQLSGDTNAFAVGFVPPLT